MKISAMIATTFALVAATTALGAANQKATPATNTKAPAASESLADASTIKPPAATKTKTAPPYPDWKRIHPRPFTAGLMSAIFPGGGQFYNHTPWRGFLYLGGGLTAIGFALDADRDIRATKRGERTGDIEKLAKRRDTAMILYAALTGASIIDAVITAVVKNKKLQTDPAFQVSFQDGVAASVVARF